MSLAAGDRLGQYEVRGVIGAGGMGEVYRAHDIRLGRDVAIKVLPTLFASDPERLARFDREARTLAALNHPHIAQVYGFEPAGTSSALVMELVEGNDLAQRLAAGPVPLDESLTIARQLVDGLEAAHELGIVHRDLKPANIKLRPDGTVKILDFGLAKAVDGPPHVDGPAKAGHYAADPAASPTITSPAMTQAGILVGTAAYMSPEQAKGKAVDKRTDIWAFGCVLHELLTGHRAFAGDDVTDTIVAIMSRDPDWSALPSATPSAVRRLLARCLTKDVRLRLRDIGDARPDLSDRSGLPAVEQGKRRSPVWLGLAMAGTSVLGLLLAMVGLSWFAGGVPPAVTRVSIVTPPNAPIELDAYSNAQEIAIANDGSRIVYTASNGALGARLMVRSVDRFETTEVTGPGESAQSPFLSPKGDWIGYESVGDVPGRSYALTKVLASGGAPAVITPIVGPLRGASWSAQDEILYATSFTASGLLRTRAAAGSKEEILTRPKVEEGEVDHYWPHPLPDGKHVLFTIRRRVAGEFDIAILSLETRTWRVLIRGGYAGRVLPTGHIVYATPGRLHVAGFDLKTLSVTTAPQQVVDGVVTKVDGTADYDVADNGTLVYVPGRAMVPAVRFSWATPSGAAVPIGIPPGDYRASALSPDGRFIAITVGEDSGLAVVVADLARETIGRVTPVGLSAMLPVWSRDGEWVAFYAQPSGGAGGLFRIRATGAGQPERLTTAKSGIQFAESWSPDGKHLFYVLPGPSPDVGPSLHRVTFKSDGIEDAVISEWAADPRVSPNGRWLAYSNLQAFPKREVEVRPFPNWDDARVVVSTGGGEEPRWRSDGREIYYSENGAVFAVEVDDSKGLQVGKPRKLFEGLGSLIGVAPDGKRFLFLNRPAEAVRTRATEVRLVFNWLEEIKRLTLAPDQPVAGGR